MIKRPRFTRSDHFQSCRRVKRCAPTPASRIKRGAARSPSWFIPSITGCSRMMRPKEFHGSSHSHTRQCCCTINSTATPRRASMDTLRFILYGLSFFSKVIIFIGPYDVGHVTEFMGGVYPVAGHPYVGDDEADVVHVKVVPEFLHLVGGMIELL